MRTRRSVETALVLLATCTLVRAADPNNEITLAGSRGLSSSDPGAFGALSYQRVFASGAVIGGSFGAGSVLPDRRASYLTARAAYRFTEIVVSSGLRPQVQVEYSSPLFMGNTTGRGLYLNLGLIGLSQQWLIYGLELQLGKVSHSGIGKPAARQSTQGLRLSLGVAF
jgi:hypothetical protein